MKLSHRFATGASACAIAFSFVALPSARTLAAHVPVFHLRLVKSIPAKGDSIAAPKAVQLWFSEAATLKVTSIKLTGPDDKEVALGAPMFSGDVKDPVAAAVTGAVQPGRYILSFKTASKDMHPITGDIAFVVR